MASWRHSRGLRRLDKIAAHFRRCGPHQAGAQGALSAGPMGWRHATAPEQAPPCQARRTRRASARQPARGQTWRSERRSLQFFLIDVEMMACQPTSRIVQATNSVQQFVQRCFLNLESEIAVDLAIDPDWSQWQWMKYFRLWQANRKVFLYPENWIEPELLPVEIKSPFFSELETDLLQNDSTKDNVETAFLSYLNKLDGVARLEIKAMWYDDSKQTLARRRPHLRGGPENLLLPGVRADSPLDARGPRSIRTSPATTSFSRYSTIAFICSGPSSARSLADVMSATVPHFLGASSFRRLVVPAQNTGRFRWPSRSTRTASGHRKTCRTQTQVARSRSHSVGGYQRIDRLPAIRVPIPPPRPILFLRRSTSRTSSSIQNLVCGRKDRQPRDVSEDL